MGGGDLQIVEMVDILCIYIYICSIRIITITIITIKKYMYICICVYVYMCICICIFICPMPIAEKITLCTPFAAPIGLDVARIWHSYAWHVSAGPAAC